MQRNKKYVRVSYRTEQNTLDSARLCEMSGARDLLLNPGISFCAVG